MNPFLKKEIRLLLPAWVVAFLLAIVPVFFVDPRDMGIDGNAGAFVHFLFMAGTILLAISPFGLESGFNTFSLMLAQPVSRRRFWSAKIGLLALAIFTVLAAYWAAWLYHAHAAPTPPDLIKLMELSGWWAIVIFAGGLWTTLLFRQIIAAFWITLITPLLLAMLASFLLDIAAVNAARAALCFAFLGLFYLLAGFFWAKRLFYQAQDTQWTGGEITFLWRKPNAQAHTTLVARQPRHWFPALVWKEIQFHQINLALAVVVLGLHLIDMVVRHIHPRFEDRDLQFGVETVWILWLLMPFLIGSAAVAEERKLGVAESQLCLPVSRRIQFTVKFVIAFLLSIFLGAVMPSLIEHTSSFGETNWLDYWIFYAAPALFLVSFYASTLTRSSLLAMAATIGIPVIVGPLVALFFNWLFYREPLSPYSLTEGRIVCLIFTAVPVLTIVLIGLMFWNFKWLHQNAKLWWRNLLVVLLSFVFICVATNAIFFRAWESLSPVDAPHGPGRLSANASPILYYDWDTLGVALPGGRIWSETLWGQEISVGKLSMQRNYLRLPELKSQRYISGSNWLSAALDYNRIVGIHSDGSLWAAPLNRNEDFKPTRIGGAADWAKATRIYNGFLLLKKDGSLWIWGTNDAENYSQRLRKNILTPPTRLGSESGWTNLSPLTTLWALAQKNDGTWWNWPRSDNGTYFSSHAIQVTNLANEWACLSLSENYLVGVKTNNELWFLYQPTNGWAGDTGIPLFLKTVKLGDEARWQAVAFADCNSGSGSLLLLGTDGILWKWLYSKNPYANPKDFTLEPFNPVRLGENSDWIAVASGDGDMGIALAADGSLWSWNQPTDHIWLAPSRKPIYLGNILAGSPPRPAQ